MKLSFEQIKSITTGAIHSEHEKDGVSFFRFSDEQMAYYKERSDAFYRNTFSTAGIKLSFRTDSENLSLAIETSPGSSRRYFSLDISVNGKYLDSLDNFSDIEVPKNYHAIKCELGYFKKSFSLGCGLKDVCIHLPWSVITKLCELEVDDGAIIEAIKPQKKLLAFGDSITQGYDALRPSSRYVARLADALGAEEFNKGIGGERFWPTLASLRDNFEPDYITIAYGTNDWRHSGDSFTDDFKDLERNSNLFFEAITQKYPDAKIFAITPLWRDDIEKHQISWTFDENEETIRLAAESRGITVIRGVDLLPHDINLFGDLILHPNDEGFKHYFENLYSSIKNRI